MKKGWWVASVVVATLGVTGTAGAGVFVTRHHPSLNHAEPFVIEEPGQPVVPLTDPGTAESAATAALSSRLSEMAADPRLGDFVGVIRDVHSGEAVWEQDSDTALRPASATKILTAAAALYELDPEERLTTPVVAGAEPGTAIIVGAGDVTISEEQLDDLAEDLEGRTITEVYVDTSLWPGEAFAESWGEQNIDAGYIGPVEPVMIEAGRLGGSRGDLPRSHTPALDVADALASRIGAVAGGTAQAAEGAEILASTESGTLLERMLRMMEDSDNVMAEAVGREIAIARGRDTSAESTAEVTMEILAEHGFDLTGTDIGDNSGMTDDNLITPALLDDILFEAATGTALRPLLGTLPVAHGSGTLIGRYEGLAGAGWVRAKTGTLTETSALAGVVTSTSGRMYTFAMVSNGANVLDSRAAMDEMTSVLRES